MRKKRFRLLIACMATFTLTASAKDEVSLSKDLMPLFQRSCAVCHQRENGNPKALKSGFLFEKKAEVLDAVGKIIIPKQPERSYLLLLITPPEDPETKKRMMPPDGAKPPRMSKEEIKQITEWIKAGAKDN